MDRQTDSKKLTASKKLVAGIVVFLLLMIAATILLWPLMETLSTPDGLEALRGWVDSVGIAGWLAMLGIQIVQVVVAFIPGEPVEVLAGMLFGAWGGLFLCLLGSAIASAVVFTITRKFGTPLVYRFFSKEKVESFAFFRDSAKIEMAAFILFLLPGTPKDMLTYVAGVSHISMGRFLLITTLARIPSVITGTVAGDMLKNDWKVALAIFVLTGAVGILGLGYRERIGHYLSKISSSKKTGQNNRKGQG